MIGVLFIRLKIVRVVRGMFYQLGAILPLSI